MKLVAVLAIICIAATGPPQLPPPPPKVVVKAVSPRVSSSSSATSKPMFVARGRTNPPPRFSAAFDLTDSTNTLAGVNFFYGSKTGFYTNNVFAPMNQLTNVGGSYPVTFVVTNAVPGKPGVIAAQTLGTNGIGSLTNSNEIIWNLNVKVGLWFQDGNVFMSIRSLPGLKYWVYNSSDAGGPWTLGPILTGNGGVLEINWGTMHDLEFFKVVEGN